MLALCGGLAGLAIGAAALEVAEGDRDGLLLTPWGEVALDARVLSVTLGLTALTALLFGLVPAIQATRLDVQAALAEGVTRSVAGGAKAGRAGCWWSPKSRSAWCCWWAPAC